MKNDQDFNRLRVVTEQEIIDKMKLLRATKIEGRRKPIRTELTKLILKTFLTPKDTDTDLPAADEPED